MDTTPGRTLSKYTLTTHQQSPLYADAYSGIIGVQLWEVWLFTINIFFNLIFYQEQFFSWQFNKHAVIPSNLKNFLGAKISVLKMILLLSTISFERDISWLQMIFRTFELMTLFLTPLTNCILTLVCITNRNNFTIWHHKFAINT